MFEYELPDEGEALSGPNEITHGSIAVRSAALVWESRPEPTPPDADEEQKVVTDTLGVSLAI